MGICGHYFTHANLYIEVTKRKKLFDSFCVELMDFTVAYCYLEELSCFNFIDILHYFPLVTVSFSLIHSRYCQ